MESGEKGVKRPSRKKQKKDEQGRELMITARSSSDFCDGDSLLKE